MSRVFILIILLFVSSLASAQKERWDVRKGNRLYNKGEYQQAEINYRKALGKDSLSVKARYNLANVLYRNQNAAAAEQEVSRLLSDSTGVSITDNDAANIFHNKGNYSLSQKKWSEAVESYKNSLRINPSDMETKSNLAYAQKMLQNEQDKNQNNDQNKDQNKDQDKDQNKDDNKDQNQDQNKEQNNDQKQNQNQPPKITPQAAQQMLQAIQNKENETQDKVKKEKAKLYERQQREKNW
ncbi:MAG: tetratricopeptide repeat protein [Bacteroidales bacterium]|nr:tetratricopeptide repeat protein [Bacteroidales bacterium]